MKKGYLLKVLTIIFVTAVIITFGIRRIQNHGFRTPVIAANANPSQEEPGISGEKVSQGAYGTILAPPNGFDPKFVRSEPAKRGLAPDFISLAGKLVFNAERTHVASARVAGRLNKILLFEGYHVEKGEALAEVYSPDYISAQNEYLLALKTHRTIKETGSPELEKESLATLESGRNKLSVLGASDDDIHQLEASGVANYFLIRSPISGTISKRNTDSGAYFNAGDPFETITDTRSIWFLGNIYEQDYAKIKIGQTLQLQSEALPGRQFTGRLSYIAPGLDPATHTLPIRCDIPNPGGELRPELFVTARLLLGDISAIIVPKTAVVHIKNYNFIIIDRGHGLYQRIDVKAIPFNENQAAVLSGLKGNENIVVEGATLINELMGEI